MFLCPSQACSTRRRMHEVGPKSRRCRSRSSTRSLARIHSQSGCPAVLASVSRWSLPAREVCQRWIHLHDILLAMNACDRRDVADQIEIELVVERGVDRVHRIGQKERIAVRRRTHDRFGGNVSGRCGCGRRKTAETSTGGSCRLEKLQFRRSLPRAALSRARRDPIGLFYRPGDRYRLV